MMSKLEEELVVPVMGEQILYQDLEDIFSYENSYNAEKETPDFEGFFAGGNIKKEVEYFDQIVEDTLTEPNYFIDQGDENNIFAQWNNNNIKSKSKARNVNYTSQWNENASEVSGSSRNSSSNEEEEEEKTYYCSLCEFSTSVETLFENHEKAHLKIQTMAAKKTISFVKKDAKSSIGKGCLPSKRKKKKDKDLGCKSKQRKLSKLPQRKWENEGKQYLCTFCNFTCSNMHTQKMHLASHKGKFFKCLECDYVANKNSVLHQHLLVHTAERKFRCTQCEHASKTKGDLKKHMSIHSQTKEFQCPECSYQTNRGFSLRRHFVVAHTQSTQYRNKRNQERKVWMQKPPQLATQTKTKSKLYDCKKCDFSTVEKSLFLIHRQSHSDVCFKCSYCDFATSWESVLKRHEENHSKVKRFSCDKCDYKTNIGRGFENHMMTHTGERRYSCPTCPYATIYKICLQRHLKIHVKKGKTIQCDLCDYETRWRNDLDLHMLEHRS